VRQLVIKVLIIISYSSPFNMVTYSRNTIKIIDMNVCIR